jgi:hypothetical protein
MCFKPCLPDLTLRSSLLLSASGTVVSSVRAYQPYYLCVDVANEGGSPSGAFKVGAGGLAVPVAPVLAVSGLGPSANTWLCFRYPTTPPPGTYRIGVAADLTHLVAETDEGNNGLTATVQVVP